jgi:hypothetical protein
VFTQSETIDLLTAVSAYDGRPPSEAQTAAWREAAARGRWTLPEALEAVHGHFAESAAWIMPAHVTERVRAARRAAPPPALPAGPDRRLKPGEGLAKIRSVFGMPGRPVPGPGGTTGTDADPAMDVECEWCRAPIGERCTVPRMIKGTMVRRPLRHRGSHPTRLDAALARRAGRQAGAQ